MCTWFQGTLPLICLRLMSHAGVKTQVMCCSGMPSSLALETAMVSHGHSLINHYILHSIVLFVLLLLYVHTPTDPCSRQLEKKGVSPPPPPAPGGLGSGAIAAIAVVACVPLQASSDGVSTTPGFAVQRRKREVASSRSTSQFLN